MDSRLEYNPEEVLTESIYVKDIGNCALEGVDDDGLSYFLVIATRSGKSHILTWGPIVPDIIELPKKAFSESYFTENYNDDKLEKFLAKWVLGGKGYKFATVTQIETKDALEQYRNIGEYMKTKMEG